MGIGTKKCLKGRKINLVWWVLVLCVTLSLFNTFIFGIWMEAFEDTSWPSVLNTV
jgi:hypothetical protein